MTGWETLSDAIATDADQFGGQYLNRITQLLIGADIAAGDSTLAPVIGTNWTFKSGKLYFQDVAGTHTIQFIPDTQSINVVIKTPAQSFTPDYMVLRTQAETLQNKVLDGTQNTFSNIPNTGIAAAAGISKSKLGALAIVDADVSAHTSTKITIADKTHLPADAVYTSATQTLSHKDLTDPTNTLPTVIPSGLNTNTGTSTQSGTGAQTVFNIPHGLATTPGNALVQANSVAAFANYIVTVNSTNIVVTYPTAPANGASLSWTWIAATSIASALTNMTIDAELNTIPNLYSPSSYIAYLAGSTYKVRNTKTGDIDYSGTDATTVLNNCLAAIRNTGQRLSLLGNTTFTLSATLTMDLAQSLYGESQYGFARLHANGNYPAITITETLSAGNANRVEIANLYITHNQGLGTYSDGLITLLATPTHPISTVDIHHCYFYDFGAAAQTSGTHTGNALKLRSTNAPIYKLSVYNCEMVGFQDQMYALFDAGDGNSWMNSNMFDTINHWNPNNSTLTVNSPSGAQFGNNFTNCITQTTGATQVGYDLNTSHAGHSWWMYFLNCTVWDITTGRDAWKFNGISEVTMLGCQPDYRIGGPGNTSGKIVKFSTYSKKYGLAQFNGVAGQKAFSVTTGLPTVPGSSTPTLQTVRVTPASANAMGEYYITTSDASAFVVNYAVAPPIGTNNVLFYWEATS